MANLQDRHHAIAGAILYGRKPDEGAELLRIATTIQQCERFVLAELWHELGGPSWVGDDASWDYAIAKVRMRIRDMVGGRFPHEPDGA